MDYAIYKEDLQYKNCPVYILNEQTNCYEMNGDNAIYFTRDDIEGQEEFLFFTTLPEAKRRIYECQPKIKVTYSKK